ncbi:MAG: 30S ribosomal protein S2 [Elusimicrobiota bacterium]
MSTITMKALLEAGAHFGHQTRRWNPKMSKYIFGKRNNIHIVDLQKTVKELKKAYRFIRDAVQSGANVLFVGTKKQAAEVIEAEATRCGAFFVSERWLGGTLTNFQTIRKSVGRLSELEKMKQEGIFKIISKKERSKRQKEMDKLHQSLRGIRNMDTIPDVVFIVDPVEEEVALREAKKMSVPVIAVCDTNANPDLIDYVIPGNDDAVRSIKVFCSIIAEAVVEGKTSMEKTEPFGEQAEDVPASASVSGEELNRKIGAGGE